jgi:hypothetical protein
VLLGTIPAGASSAADQKFRAELGAWFSQMERVDAFLRSHAVTDDLMAADSGSAIRAGRLAVSKMSGEQIWALRQVFAAQPGWQQGPSRILAMLQANDARLGSSARVGGPAKFSLTPDCDPGIGADPPPGGLSRADVHIAEGVQLAAEVAANVSDVLLPDTADVITAALFGVYAAAGAATLTVAGIYDTADECQSIQLDAYIRSMGGQGANPATALVSLIDLRQLSSGIDTKVTALQTTVNNIQTTVNATQTTVNNIQTTVNATQTTVNNIQTVVNNTQQAVTAEAERNLRLRIEETLADPSVHTVISFELPQAFGGFLEKVRQVVTDSVTNAGSAGLSVGTANSFLAKGNAAFTARDWKSAYSWYGKAYRALA